MKTTRLGGNAFSADEKSILFHSNKTGVYNVYTVSVAGGKQQPLTNSTEESIYAISYFPDDSRFIYTYDRGGNENNHLFVREKNGSERDLTPGEKTKASFHGWSRDNQSFYLSTNERDPRFFDVYEMKASDYSRKLLYQDDGGYILRDVSDDGKYVALYKQNSLSNTDIYIYDVQTKQMRNITPHQGDVWFKPQTFVPDSPYFYYLTDDNSEIHYLVRYKLETGQKETVERDRWEILSTYVSPRGKYRVSRINEDGRVKLNVYDQTNKKMVPLPKMPEGVISDVEISPSENLMSFYLSSDRSPNNLYVYNFRTRKLTQLTEALNPEINPAHLVESQVIRYKSFDELEISALLYKPHQASAKKKVPALIYVHGAPGAQSRKEYDALFQFLINHGYAILAVNQRGSQGYGKTFFNADNKKYGREPLWDCVEAKKYLAALDFVDAEKIGIIGASGGGYMVLAALAFQPEQFAVGIDIFGIASWIGFLESIPPQWEAHRKGIYAKFGDPVADREMLRATSPLFHADKIKKPLLVLQGANDPRVPKAESDGIVEAVRKNKGIVEYLVFPDEGHGFSKRANEIRANETILNFLDRYLKRAK